jgi:hypothetical protein
MPSVSLVQWQTDRMPRLADIDAQCAACGAAVPTRANLIDENLRGYVLLLSAHFQGFCRDLYTECAVMVVSRVRPTLRVLIEAQFATGRKLDHGNPSADNLRHDFERFNVHFDLVSADPTNRARVTDLGVLNKLRNMAAHHGTVPVGVPSLSLPLLQALTISCDGLAGSLDAMMYNQLRKLLRRAPW